MGGSRKSVENLSSSFFWREEWEVCGKCRRGISYFGAGLSWILWNMLGMQTDMGDSGGGGWGP